MSASLKFSRAQLHALGQMMCLALQVAQSVRETDRTRYSSWAELYSKILDSIREDPQLAGSIAFQDDKDFPLLEDLPRVKATLSDCLDEFRDNVFWEELVVRMADKALIERLGEASFNAMSEFDRRQKTENLEQSIWDEVSQHGIERLEFVLPPEEF